MKCTIGNANLAAWSRIITSLTSIGDEEVHFAFTDSTLTLTVFNASLSVSSTCTLFSSFFQQFYIPRSYCKTFKLPAKCITKPFRSLRFIKGCNFCEIAFEEGADTISITMGCKSLAEIKYTINLLDNVDELNADYEPDSLANWIRADPKFMSSNLTNFAHGKGLGDLTLKAQQQGNKVVMKNCATDLMRKEGKIYTELSLSTLAFDRFTITEDTEVTFQLKDFKVFIALAEHMKIPMTIHFDGALDPVIVCLKSEQFEGMLMMAPKFVNPSDIADYGSQASSASSNIISNVSSDGGALPDQRRARVPTAATSNNKRNPTTYAKNLEPNAGIPILVRPSMSTHEVEEVPPSTFELPKRKSRHPSRPRKNKEPSQDEIEDRENAGENNPPSRKRTRDVWAKMSTTPFDVYKSFPGHDIVLVAASSDEED